ncbi:hypothetical protein Saso_54600 [Streptomyces asoensis]|uniref:Uncharacterized protein n=1 Tax=Streptomyces asoensis TaxID=249586 RepID=A0ABQ3S725_9ACTN|nr:hypothetical protein GCM10010496_47030 [Streptomyces asoensis]GHI63810.1 hypothetical protein Saso_54600 [Streptomyces asoensis]
MAPQVPARQGLPDPVPAARPPGPKPPDPARALSGAARGRPAWLRASDGESGSRPTTGRWCRRPARPCPGFGRNPAGAPGVALGEGVVRQEGDRGSQSASAASNVTFAVSTVPARRPGALWKDQ